MTIMYITILGYSSKLFQAFFTGNNLDIERNIIDMSHIPFFILSLFRQNSNQKERLLVSSKKRWTAIMAPFGTLLYVFFCIYISFGDKYDICCFLIHLFVFVFTSFCCSRLASLLHHLCHMNKVLLFISM